MNANLPPLDAYLTNLALLDQQCEEANIDENDFTTYTYDELAYELGLVKSSVAKKLSFLENQMVARNMTNLTPIQLEEFESVFRHFDRDLTNSLQELEFSAALASLSLVYDEHEMHANFVAISAGRGYVTFEQFIRFMVSVTEDQNTAEQVFQSFAEVADGKVREVAQLSLLSNLPFTEIAFFSSTPPLIFGGFWLWVCLCIVLPCSHFPLSTKQPYITEVDLRHSLIPDDLVEDLLSSMPEHKGPDLQEDRHRAKYDYVRFMEQMTQGGVRGGGREGGRGGGAAREGGRGGGREGGGGGVNGGGHGGAREGY